MQKLDQIGFEMAAARRIWVTSVLIALSAATAHSGTYSNMTQYPVPTPDSAPNGIVAGPDGAVWFTENAGNKIGRITIGGAITEYLVPTAASQPNGITVGPDRALWFTETSGNRIGRITTSGVVTEYIVPTPNSAPVGITTGPDGAIWFAEQNAAKIGRLAAGGFTEYTGPGRFQNGPEITVGPDGALWVNQFNIYSYLIRTTTTGQMTQYSIPDINCKVDNVTTGPDGALWFGCFGSQAVGRMTTDGVVSEWGTGGGSPIGITAGPDGAVWFNAYSYGCYPTCQYSVLGRITTSGVITRFQVPTLTSSSIPFSANGIATGPDGNLWLAEGNANEIVRAPACALGLTVTFSGQTLTTSFNVGIDRPAIWSIVAQTTVLTRKPTTAVVPPAAFTFNWPFPNAGSVIVDSALSTAGGTVICSESSTVKTSQ